MIAKEQRDQALACAYLAFIIAMALVVSSFRADLKTAAALEAVRQHREILAQHQRILRENEAVLEQNLIALENVRKK